jgi:hypothetical protein
VTLGAIGFVLGFVVAIGGTMLLAFCAAGDVDL